MLLDRPMVVVVNFGFLKGCLKRLEALSPWCGIYTNTACRVMIDYNEDRYLLPTTQRCRSHVRSPYLVESAQDDGPVMLKRTKTNKILYLLYARRCNFVQTIHALL